MSERYVALLRGINVGQANRVAMADLRSLVTGLGYTEVRTLLNSGNVVFGAGAGAPTESAAHIEKALADRLGVSARVTVVRASTLAEIAERNPLLNAARDPSKLLVAFLAEPDDIARLRPLAEQDWAPEAIALGVGVAYLWCPNGVSSGGLWKAVGGVLGDAVTSRNWATVCKLLALAADPGRPDDSSRRRLGGASEPRPH